MENSSSLVGIEQLFRPQPGQTIGDYASLTRCAVGLRRARDAKVSNGKEACVGRGRRCHGAVIAVWQRSSLSRIARFLAGRLQQLALIALSLFILPLILYLYREVTRDSLIIDPSSVPQRFKEAGVTETLVGWHRQGFRQFWT
jgi:hypothetical protein